MKRNLLLGALHPVLFLVAIYIVSFLLAFFVCTTIYNSLQGTASMDRKKAVQVEAITVLK